MKSSILKATVLSFSLFVTSCMEDPQSINLPHTEQHSDLRSIDSLIQEKSAISPDQFYVITGNFDDEEIFLFDYCCPFCQGKTELYDSKGKFLCTLSNDIELSTIFCLYSENEIEITGVYWLPGNLDCFLE